MVLHLVLGLILLGSLPATAFAQGLSPNAADTEPRIEEVRQTLEEQGYRVRVLPIEESSADFQPVPLQDLLSMAADNFWQKRGESNFATVESITYEATVSGEDLRNGQLVADVHSHGHPVAMLDWSSTNLAISTISSRLVNGSDGETKVPLITSERTPARWGTAPDGRVLVLMDGDHTELTGRWSSHGKTLGGTTSRSDEAAARQSALPLVRQFELRLPPALQSTLKLRVPAERRLVASAGLLSGPTASETPEWMLWTLDLGRRQDVRLTVDSPPTANEGKARGRVETAYSARGDGLHLQLDVGFKAFGGSISQLEIQIPPNVELQDATVNRIPVPIRFDSEKPNRARIDLGLAPPDQFYQLRVSAHTPVAWGERLKLPRLGLPGLSIASEKLTLFAETPLVVHELTPANLVQTGFTADVIGEMWTFQSLEPSPELELFIDQPAVEFMTQSETVVAVQDSMSAAICRLNLQSQFGTGYRVQLRIPLDWQVLDIRPDLPDVQQISWIETKAKNWRDVVLEFTRAIPPDRPEVVWLTLHGPTTPQAEPLTFPRIQVESAGEHAAACWFALPRGRIAEPLTEITADFEQNAGPPPDELWDGLKEQGLAADGEPVETTLFRWSRPNTPPDQVRITQNPNASVMREEDLMDQTVPTSKPNPVEEGGQFAASMSMELITNIDPSHSGQHYQRAKLDFTKPVFPQQLNLTLPENCFISAVVVHGEHVTVLRRGTKISFPENTSATRNLELTYVVAESVGVLWQDLEFPIPMSSIPVSGFKWSIHSRNWHHFELLTSTDAVTSRQVPMPLHARLLGPLARTSSDSLFNPLRKEQWDGLWGSTGHSGTTPDIEEFVMVGESAPEKLAIRYWNMPRLKAAAWSLVFACAWIGIAIRCWSRGLLGYIVFPWLLVLVWLALFLPDATAMLAGAAFIGSLLSQLVPRSFVRPTATLTENSSSETSERSTSTKAAVAVSSLIMVLLVGWQSSSFAQTGDAIETTRQVTLFLDDIGQVQAGIMVDPVDSQRQLPAYFLSGAEYEFLDVASATVRGNFNILVLKETDSLVVRLPLAKVALPNRNACQIDDQPGELIPSSTGDSMLIAIPNARAGSRHAISVEFSVRSGSPGNLTAIIPNVASASATFSAELNPPDLLREGATRKNAAGNAIVALGAVSQLTWPDLDASPQPMVISVQSNVLVEAALASVTSAISLTGAGGAAVSTDFLLPLGTDIKKVQGPHLIESQIIDSGPRGMWLRVETSLPTTSLQIDFEVPNRSLSDGQAEIPPLLRVPGQEIAHRATISTTPFLRLESLHDAQGNAWPTISPESTTAAGDQNKLSVPLGQQPLIAKLTPVPRRLSVEITDTCRVDRNEIKYAAQVQLDPGAVPWFMHQLELQPEWRVRDVRVEQQGVVRPVRWNQKGGVCSLFLADIASGPRTVLLEATRPLSPEAWVDLPRLMVNTGEISTRQLVVEDLTNWSVQVETAAGAILSTVPTKGTESKTSKQLLFQITDEFSPERLRLMPDASAARVDSVAQLSQVDDQNWRCTQQVHVLALEAKIHRVGLSIPNELMDRIEINPPLVKSVDEALPDSGTAMTLIVPPRMRDSATISLSWTISDTEMKTQGLRTCQVTSAQTASQFLLLPMDAELQVRAEGGRVVSGASLPNWIPPRWIQAARAQEAACYQLVSPDIRLEAHPHRLGQGHIPWAELLLWLNSDGTSEGQLRFWGTCPREFTTNLILTEGMELLNVEALSGGTVELGQPDGTSQELHIKQTDGVFDVAIQWKDSRPLSALVSLPQLRPVTPERMLLAVRKNAEVNAVPGTNVREISPASVPLEQFAGYLDVLDGTTNSLPISSNILRKMRQSRDHFENASEVSALQTTRRSAILERWRQLERRLPVSADEAPIAEVVPQQLDQLLELDQSLLFWGLTDGECRDLEIRRQQIAVWPVQQLSFGVLLLFIISAAAYGRFLGLGEWLAIHPAVTVSVLGAFWWLWLSPSALGGLLLVSGLLWLIFGLVGKTQIGSDKGGTT